MYIYIYVETYIYREREIIYIANVFVSTTSLEDLGSKRQIEKLFG